MSAEQHAAFVLSTANLLAAAYGVSPQEEGLLPLDHPQRDAQGTARGVSDNGSLPIGDHFFSTSDFVSGFYYSVFVDVGACVVVCVL